MDRSTSPLKSLDQQVILDHYRKPRNQGELEDSTVEVHMRNPTCGDEIKLQLRIADDRIEDVRFLGEGCSISQASVSMMSGLLKGQALDDALALARRFTSMMHGSEEAAKDPDLGNLRSLAGVAAFPVRVKCALLGFDALQEAMKRSRDGTTEEDAGPGPKSEVDGIGTPEEEALGEG
jgi:nitrogen fixation protein NifU and related proteins